jgi:hypothetical protein
VTIEITIFAAVLLGVLGGLLLERFRTYFEAVEEQKHVASGGERALARPRVDRQLPALPRSPTVQLQQVTDARFSQRRLINNNEEQIFQALEVIIHDLDLDWRVMAQVNLAEVVESSDPDALAAIGDQRVALLVVSAAQMPLAAVEYQAMGQVRDEGTLRSAIKREALRRADIEHIEIRSNDTPEILRDQVRRLAARVAAVTGVQPILSAGPIVAPGGNAPAPQATPRKPKGRPASGMKP